MLPIDEATGTTPVRMTFATVDSTGNTTLVLEPGGTESPDPDFFELVAEPPLRYEIATDAVFSESV